MAIRKPEGTSDMLPGEARFYRRFTETAFALFDRYGFEPIQTPVFEQTDLFVRGIGEATDVVGKEMFTAVSGGNLAKLVAGEKLRSSARLSLRPEGTAGVVRAVAEHGMAEPGGAPVKLAYAGPMFRAERPQRGRQRQFHQVGVECLGAASPSVDAEVIIMLMRFFEALGIPRGQLRLLVNCMGDDACRPAYREALAAYVRAHADAMCEDCLRRVDVNPLRTLDCKEPGCVAVMANAPQIGDYLCDECRAHYETVKRHLDAAGVAYVEDPTLVRGLDYYTRTVFEVQSTALDSNQNALGGGGRYDGLMQEIGGKPAPGVGFALGYERCVIALEAAGAAVADAAQCDVFVAAVDGSCRDAAFSLAQACRDAGLACELDHQDRSLKSQFKLADRIGARTVAVLGPDELAAGVAKLRDMATREERAVPLAQVPAALA